MQPSWNMAFQLLADNPRMGREAENAQAQL